MRQVHESEERMTIEFLVNHIQEKVSDLKEAMNEKTGMDIMYFGMLQGELSAYQDVLFVIEEMRKV